MLGGGWEDWSAAETVPVTIGPASAQVPINFKDTWKISAGVHYRLSDAWLLQTGFTYDSSALDTKDRIAALPIDQQWRLGIGTIWNWTPTRQVGFSFQWANLGEARLDNSAVKGSYRSNDLYVFNVNINWSKLPWSGKATF
jgi:long-chain fatty acid transport protein